MSENLSAYTFSSSFTISLKRLAKRSKYHFDVNRGGEENWHDQQHDEFLYFGLQILNNLLWKVAFVPFKNGKQTEWAQGCKLFHGLM